MDPISEYEKKERELEYYKKKCINSTTVVLIAILAFFLGMEIGIRSFYDKKPYYQLADYVLMGLTGISIILFIFIIIRKNNPNG
jgi:uncharacterized membrane protein